MKRFKAVFIVSILVIYLAFIAVFSCGCEESYAKSKKQNDYILSQRGIEFQEGADRPPTMKTLYSIAKIFIHQGRYNEAEVVLQKVINQNPKFMPAYNDLAEIKIRKRQTNEAIKILSKAVKKNSSDPQTLNNLGMCWIVRRKYEKALKIFTKAAGLAPENTRYRANMAVALGFLKRDEEALALYRQILPEEQANKNISIIRQARNSASKTNN